MRFPLRPPHVAGEPAHGYALRLVEVNAYDWQGNGFRHRGTSLSALANGLANDVVLSWGQGQPAALAASTLRRHSAKTYRLAGEILHKDQVTTDRKRFCPACWRDDHDEAPAGTPDHERPWRRHLRSWWSVTPVTTCPIHCVELTECCPCCGSETRLIRGFLTRCACGGDLTLARTPSVSEADARADAYIVGRLGGLPATSVPTLDQVPLLDAIALLERVGLGTLAGRGARVTALPAERRGEVLRAGFAVIVLGDAGMDEFLARLIDEPGDVGQGIAGRLGQFYLWFVGLPRGRLRTWLSRRIGAQAKRRGYPWHRHASNIMVPSRLDRITFKEAQELLGRGRYPADRVLSQAGLLPTRGKERLFAMIDRAAVADLRAALDALLDCQAAARRMGLAPKSLLGLLKEGLLRSSELGRVAFRHTHWFDPAELDRTIARLRQGSPGLGTIPSGGVLLAEASRLAGPGGLARACLLIVDGTLPVIGTLAGKVGIGALVVERATLKKVMNGFDASDFTVAEAAVALRLRHETVTSLIARGHLEAHATGTSAKIIRRGEIERFRATFVTSSSLAEEWQTSTKMVLARLRRRGLAPAIHSEFGGRNQVSFFEREAVSAAFPRRCGAGKRHAAPERPREPVPTRQLRAA